MNGKYTKPIKISGGLRQGDPISPYLLFFSVDVLFRQIEKAVMEEKLIGIRINREDPVPHNLFFADDSLFFVRGTHPNMQTLWSIIDDYYCAYGQGVNLRKSSLFPSLNIQEEDGRNLENAMRIQSVQNLGKYLVLPSMWGR